MECRFLYGVYVDGKLGERLYPTNAVAEEVRRRVVREYVAEGVESQVVELHIPAKELHMVNNTPARDNEEWEYPISRPRETDTRTLRQVMDSAWDAWERRFGASDAPDF